MRDQLTQYIDLLFAGTSGTDEIRQEILQNTLDHYDDLVSRGYAPEDAYRNAISGIGDINELLTGQRQEYNHGCETRPVYAPDPSYENSAALVTRIIRAVAICMYIASPAPILLLEPFGMDDFGCALMLLIIAAATALLLIFRKKPANAQSSNAPVQDVPFSGEPCTASGCAQHKAKSNAEKKNNSLITALTLVLYFIISFITEAWFITWLIFPIVASIKKKVNASADMNEN